MFGPTSLRACPNVDCCVVTVDSDYPPPWQNNAQVARPMYEVIREIEMPSWVDAATWPEPVAAHDLDLWRGPAMRNPENSQATG